MQPFKSLFRSTLGKKYIMALTGIGLFIFVVGHLLGNLQIFLGPEALNRYASFLKSNAEFLWLARGGLLLLVGLHIWSAIQLTLENRAARPIAYGGNPKPVAASYASRTMIMSGVILASFVVYHLLHFTLFVTPINLTGHDFGALHDPQTGKHDVFRMMVLGFSNGWVSLFYIVSIGLLCMHLRHGLTAMFSSLGLKAPHFSGAIEKFAAIAAWGIFLGYISIPLAVFLGYGRN
jgi:succinate dehydrogenase / fumarate reductase, cytochrome b subunit